MTPIEEALQALILHAQLLRNANPEAYGHFLVAFRGLTNAVTVAVTHSPPSDILIDQGKARLAMELYEVLTHAEPPQP